MKAKLYIIFFICSFSIAVFGDEKELDIREIIRKNQVELFAKALGNPKTHGEYLSDAIDLNNIKALEVFFEEVSDFKSDKVFTYPHLFLRDAIEKGTPPMLELLLKSGFDLNIGDQYSNRFLSQSASLNNKQYALKNVKLLLKYGYKNKKQEFIDSIVTSIDHENLELLKFLYSRPEFSNINENKLLWMYSWTFVRLNKEIWDFLVESGFDVNASYFDNNTVEKEKTPYLHDCVDGCSGRGDGDCRKKEKNFKWVLSYGADINIQDVNGDTISHKVAKKREKKNFLFFKTLGADPTIKNNNGETATDILKGRTGSHNKRVNKFQFEMLFVFTFLAAIFVFLLKKLFQPPEDRSSSRAAKSFGILLLLGGVVAIGVIYYMMKRLQLIYGAW